MTMMREEVCLFSLELSLLCKERAQSCGVVAGFGGIERSRGGCCPCGGWTCERVVVAMVDDLQQVKVPRCFVSIHGTARDWCTCIRANGRVPAMHACQPVVQ